MKRLIICFSLIIILSNKYSLGQVKSEPFRIGDIVDSVDEKYAAFGLVDYQKEQQSAYHVEFLGDVGNLKLIGFCRSIGSNDIYIMEEIELFLLKDGKIIDKRHEEFGRDEDPEFEILHDTFIQYIELYHDWYEDDIGVMRYDEKNDHLGGLRYVLKEEKLVPLTELSKAELRIYRNLIFAKYGFVFKSDDLNNYFKSTSWYKPDNQIKVEQVMNEQDKELVNYIKNLESVAK